ncbi:hypothetical protein GGI20_003055 [Coemansia sp. BCRC 34301]|nr:hypothetical protein GGI20_003055 [Coemansia sp. BCRC 34301]
MKFSFAIGAACVLFAQGNLAGKCPPPVYATSSAPSQATLTLTNPIPTATQSPPLFYTSVKDPFTTKPMPTDFSHTYSASSVPVPTPSSPVEVAYRLSQKQLDLAIPARAAADSCASVSTPGECVTNAKALVAINNALSKYRISKRSEVVAVIALMAYESGSWQYNTNHFPGRPGQGTRAMLMFNFIESYAKALHPDEAAKALAGGMTDEAKNAVRALVLNDDDSFGSGFWYLVNNAAAYHEKADKLRDGNLDDFKDYVVTGVGAGWDSTRQTIWETVNTAIAA